MRNYGQFCPIARGSEVLAERWTPIIVRNILLGCHTFNEIAAGAPGLSRALLTRRLHELERAGVIQIRPKPDGHGSLYEPTPVGSDLLPVLLALGRWAERWMDITPEHADPDVVLWSWCQEFLRRDLLPDRRVVVRFDFPFLGHRTKIWMLIERREVELCRVDPGFGDDLVVTINDPLIFARWHVGLVDWAVVLRAGPYRSADLEPCIAPFRPGTPDPRPGPKGAPGSSRPPGGMQPQRTRTSPEVLPQQQVDQHRQHHRGNDREQRHEQAAEPATERAGLHVP